MRFLSANLSSHVQHLLLIALLLGLAAVPLRAAELTLALHPPPEISSLTINQARSIFSMRTRMWPDGTPITVFVLPDDNPSHKDFVRGLLTLLPHQLKRNWDRLVYTGIGQAPIEVADEQEMLEQLRNTPGGIGYIETGTQDESLRLVTLQ